MIKIYHNPRCTKSRQGIAFLEENNKEFQVVKYLENPLSKEQLTEIISILNIKPIELVRKTEKVWKELFKGKELSDNQIIEAMVNHPKLIERPIAIHGNKGAIGRPTEEIASIF